MQKLSIILIIACLALAVTAAETYKKGDYYHEKEIHKFSKADALDILTRNGNIDINKWSKDYIEVVSLKKAKNEYDLDNISIKKEQKKSHAYIASVFNTSVIRNMSVDFDVRIPGNVRVNFAETKNGNIYITFSNGDIDARTSNGNIDLSSINGCVNAQTSNGNIDVQAKTIKNIDTSNGNIVMSIDRISRNTKIQSSNGNIKLLISEMPSIIAQLKTSMGKISLYNLDADFSTDKKTHKEFTVSDGKHKLNIETSLGDIIIKKE